MGGRASGEKVASGETFPFPKARIVSGFRTSFFGWAQWGWKDFQLSIYTVSLYRGMITSWGSGRCLTRFVCCSTKIGTVNQMTIWNWMELHVWMVSLSFTSSCPSSDVDMCFFGAWRPSLSGWKSGRTSVFDLSPWGERFGNFGP